MGAGAIPSVTSATDGPVPHCPPHYIPSSSFDHPRDGYVFRSGSTGPGFYRDVNLDSHVRRFVSAVVHDVCSSHRDGQSDASSAAQVAPAISREASMRRRHDAAQAPAPAPAPGPPIAPGEDHHWFHPPGQSPRAGRLPLTASPLHTPSLSPLPQLALSVRRKNASPRAGRPCPTQSCLQFSSRAFCPSRQPIWSLKATTTSQSTRRLTRRRRRRRGMGGTKVM